MARGQSRLRVAGRRDLFADRSTGPGSGAGNAAGAVPALEPAAELFDLGIGQLEPVAAPAGPLGAQAAAQ